MDQFFQQLVNGLTLGSLYALIAVGYTVVYGIVQLINFAHGEVFMIGAFGALTTYLLFFDGKTNLWILPIMIIGAIFASVGTAVAMERVAYRPLRNAPRLAPLITAIGISVFLQEFVRLFYERPGWTLFAFAGMALGIGYYVGTRVSKAELNHPVTKWYDRAALIGAVVGPVAVWAVVRQINNDLTAVLVVGVVIVGAIVGTAIGWLAGLAARRRARTEIKIPAIAASAATAAVAAVVGWVLFEKLINSITWPSAKQRIPFPQIDVVTGTAIEIGGVTIQRSAIFTMGALAICAILLWFFINRTRLGRGMQAVSQDPDTARLMGINVDRIIVVAFALGAVLAAIAGVSQGLQNNNIDFRMGFLAGLKAFTAAVLGGIGNIYGAVVGGLVLGVIEAMATQYIPGQFGGSTWKDVWAFVILILVLVFRPQGLLGARVVDRA
ncbi:branched-chain amino acid ABC transporter permease [Kribbella sp. NBC_01510]|uniref:branched-chain amino acid ABC transporter permease n=2 Tax=unclassified Kribbella TaxID=2644121 RepID=UPI002E30F54B|nr:branched-chain amino acid ABC transporter permease [Kribbella sp. NBC_01484]